MESKYKEGKEQGYRDAKAQRPFDPPYDGLDIKRVQGYHKGYRKGIESLRRWRRISKQRYYEILSFVDGYFRGEDKVLTAIINAFAEKDKMVS